MAAKKVSDDYSDEERTVWQNLIQFRDQAGLSLAQAAARSGLKQITIRSIEKGVRNIPKAINLKRLVEAYGRSIGDVHKDKPGALDRTRVPMFALDVIDEDAVEPKLLEEAREMVAKWNARHAESFKGKKAKP